MTFITEWITNIILFVFIAILIDMLLPSSAFQRYTKMVMGLLLIAVILSPIIKLVHADFEQLLGDMPLTDSSQQKNLENSIEMKKKEIQASQDAYILEQMTNELMDNAEEELMKEGLILTDITLSMDESKTEQLPSLENLQKITIYVAYQDTKNSEAIEAVKNVEINQQEPLPTNSMEMKDQKYIASLLSQKWNVAEDMIEVMFEGRKQNSHG
ncbi:stage III sporulation protein AF [Bacillaceae bacterium Marseille-Q3522]|nr:stage III sporulation protein AF [Bacillaceae bacterium Marseille-Q3522]